VGVFDAPSWLANPAAQPETVRALLALQAAIAARDPATISASGGAVLALPPESLAPLAREQALAAAMLAAIASGRPADAARLESTHGPSIPPSRLFGMLRSWLLAWADGASRDRAVALGAVGQ
jgi:hypothetical protein